MVETCRVSPREYDNLAIYLSSFPGETRGPSDWKNRFLLWWEKNPAFSDDLERGWFLRAEQGIVGFIGSIPTFFQLQGRGVIAHNVTSWRVLPPYRKHSLTLLFRWVAASKNSILFDTTPTPAVTQMLRKLEFRPFPRGENHYCTMVINQKNVIRSLLAKASVPSWLVSMVSPFSRFLPTPSRRSFERKDSFLVRKLDQADLSFDDLWERRRHTYANTGVRTARVINWYCFAGKAYEKLLFACSKDGGLKAYVILVEDTKGKCRALRCLDVWGDLEVPGVLEALFEGIWEYGRADSFDVVYFPHFSRPIGKKFRSFPFICRRYREGERYFRVDHDRYGSIDEKNSYFTDFHGDQGL